MHRKFQGFFTTLQYLYQAISLDSTPFSCAISEKSITKHFTGFYGDKSRRGHIYYKDGRTLNDAGGTVI